MKAVRMTFGVLLALAWGTGAILFPVRVGANHPVLVEGNNATNAGPGATLALGGTAGDYDGDTRVGTAEDNDGAADRIFGTLNAALAAANGGANANGHVMIVTSGRFPEQINLNTVNGVTILEAAPGVQATIDAVLQGDAGNAARQAGVGITVDIPTNDRTVILRNLVVRNFNIGLLLRNRAHVVVENCRFDSNLTANVMANGQSDLTMTNCSVVAGGQRFNPDRNNPSPGDGISFSGSARGSIAGTTIAYNEGAGIRNTTARSIKLVTGNNINDNDDGNIIGSATVSPF